MFLKCVSYDKSLSKKSNNSRKNSHLQKFLHLSTDQNAFNDFFIRKHSSNLTHQYNQINYNQNNPSHSQQKNQANKSVQTEQKQLPKDFFNLDHITKNNYINTPHKKGFQIKFIQQKAKNLLYVKNNFVQNSNSQNKQQENQLIYQRKLKQKPYFTPKSTRSSIRYYQIDSFAQNQNQRLSNKYNSQRKSLDSRQRQKPTKSSNNLQKDNHILINSYKIKSLVLERNPKEDFNKEKKFVKKILEFKNKSINLQKQKPIAQNIIKNENENDSFLQHKNNLLKLQKYNNDYLQEIKTQRIRNQIELPFASQTKSQNKKLSNLSSNFQSLNFKENQIKIQPWVKISHQDALIMQKDNHIVTFPNSIHPQIDFLASEHNLMTDSNSNNYRTNKNTITLSQQQQVRQNNLNHKNTMTGQVRTAKNPYRRINSMGRNSIIAMNGTKGTIQSNK